MKRLLMPLAAALLCFSLAGAARGETAAKWIRLVLKQKYAWSTSSKDSLRVSECALYDADGVQQGVGLAAVDPSTDPVDMPPGTCLVSTPYTTTSANVKYIFDGTPTGDKQLSVTGLPTQSVQPYCLISVTNSATWTTVVAHLPDSANPIASYLLYVGHQNWQGSQHSIARWTLEASYDGVTWFTVHDQSKSDAVRPTANNQPYNGGVPYVLTDPPAMPVLQVDSDVTNAFNLVATDDVVVEKVGAGQVVSTNGTGAAALKVAEGTFSVAIGEGRSAAMTGVATVAEGATLELSGDVSMSRIVNSNGTISIAADTSLTASPPAGDTGFMYGGGISGAGGLVMSGAGVLEMDGSNTYTGDTVVQSGVLRFGRGNVTPARWFRIIFKSKFDAPSSPGTLSVQEFALFDAEGVQQNAGLSVVDPSVASRQMAPGTCKVESNYTATKLNVLFDGVTGTDNSTPDFSVTGLPVGARYCAMSVNDPSTWVTVTLHLADSANAVTSYNLYIGHYNWEGTERSPNRWTIEASCNGEDWFVVDNQLSGVTNPGGHNRWYNGGVPFALSAPATSAAGALPSASVLEVGGGGVVTATNATVEVANLRIDCTAAAGTLDGLAFAPSGTLHLKNASGYQMGSALPLLLSNMSGTGNLRAWSVRCDGAAVDGVRFKVVDGVPIVESTGFRMLIR